MSNIQYGLISETDARTLEKTIDLISDQKINILEVGIYGGDTGRGLKEYCQSIRKECFITGIDNNRDGEKLRFDYDRLIIGNSTEVYNQVEDNSQHLVFIDSCHCFAHSVSDFFCYQDKIKRSNYFAFHDTGEHIKAFSGFQHGDRENANAYISVRKSLQTMGVLWKRCPILKLDEDELAKLNLTQADMVNFYQSIGFVYNDNVFYYPGYPGWELIFDDADKNDPMGGVCVFKRLF